MEWFVLAAPVPAPVSFGGIGTVTLLAALAATLVPVVVALRYALSNVSTHREGPRLRVIEGAGELRRHAA